MFQILNLVKRLDATEVAMTKLASMMEDLAKEQAHQALRGSIGSAKGAVSFKSEGRPLADDGPALRMLPSGQDQTGSNTNPEAVALDLLVKSQELRGSLGGSGVATDITSRILDLDQRVTEIEKSTKSFIGLDSTSKKSAGITSTARSSGFKSVDEYSASAVDQPPDLEAESGTEGGGQDFARLSLSKMPSKDAIAILQRELIQFKQFFMDSNVGAQALKEVEELKEAIMTGTNQGLPPDVKVGQIDLKMNELKEQVNHLDTVYHQQFVRIDNGIQNLEKEISALWERINTGMPAGDATLGAEGQNVGELYNKLLQLQDNMNFMSDTATKLLSEREGRQNTLDVMIEQIELLKTVKADKEDLEDALADKADACQINRKVSHEQFDAAYDEISKALTDHLSRLQKQEEMWEQGLLEIQKEISGKLDKMELMPLRDFINSKLKMVQDKVKKISAMKEEYEAAGTKSRFLRNVNCISCDADVVMKKQNDLTMFPKPYAMPPSKNVGPYLAYELDQLRKHQKSLANSKNLNMLESAMAQAKNRTGDKDHLCNRYCGGSHTVTTPQQRVLRVGHFMEQWGPEIAPVKDVLIRGTDGHLYKGRDDSQLRALAAEKAPTPRVENPVMTISEVPGYGDSSHRSADAGGDVAPPKREASKPHSAVGLAPGPTRSSLDRRPKTSIDRIQSKQSVRSGASGDLKEIKASSDKAMPTTQKSQDLRGSVNMSRPEVKGSTEKTPSKQGSISEARPKSSIEQKIATGSMSEAKPKSNIEQKIATGSMSEAKPKSNIEQKIATESMSEARPKSNIEQKIVSGSMSEARPKSNIEQKIASVTEVEKRRSSQRSAEIRIPSNPEVPAPEEEAPAPPEV